MPPLYGEGNMLIRSTFPIRSPFSRVITEIWKTIKAGGGPGEACAAGAQPCLIVCGAEWGWRAQSPVKARSPGAVQVPMGAGCPLPCPALPGSLASAAPPARVKRNASITVWPMWKMYGHCSFKTLHDVCENLAFPFFLPPSSRYESFESHILAQESDPVGPELGGCSLYPARLHFLFSFWQALVLVYCRELGIKWSWGSGDVAMIFAWRQFEMAVRF